MDSARWPAWVQRYEAAWRAPGVEALERLFTKDATYRTAPFEPPFVGHEAIGGFWEAARLGPDEAFTLAAEPVAVQPPTGVIRVEVRYGAPRGRTYRDLWIVTLEADDRCSAFEEWPFWPPDSGGSYASGPAAGREPEPPAAGA